MALPVRSRPARVALAYQVAGFLTPCTVSIPSRVTVHWPFAGSGDGSPVAFCGTKFAVLNFPVSMPKSSAHLSRSD